LPDRRQPGKVIYPLDGILLLCRLAVLAGAESFVDIARFGEKKLELLDMMAIEAAVVTIDSMCKRRRDFAAAGRSKSAARTQARRSPPSGAFLLVAFHSYGAASDGGSDRARRDRRLE
jgi:hypothetical protein